MGNSMATPLEKARKDPESMKARILQVARRFFGDYGYHGTTTRMVAKEVGIDISTLHYHWGDKKDLYEAVILDINKDLGQKLTEVERLIHGLPLEQRMTIAIDAMTDYLFEFPEISNLVLFHYFSRTRDSLDLRVPEFTADIARSMGLTRDRKITSPRAKIEVLAVMNAIHNFISGENFFRPIVGLKRKDYISTVKETLKFVLIGSFVEREKAEKTS